MQTVRAADTNEVVKLIFRESDNDRKVNNSMPSVPVSTEALLNVHFPFYKAGI